MGLHELEINVNYEITWRTNEISIVKTIPFLYDFSIQQREVLKKHTIPIFYSLWEGFVVDIFSIYTREVNSLNLSKNQICSNMLVHAIDSKYRLKHARVEFEKQVSFIKELNNYLDNDIQIPVNIPTESNVNLKVLNNLLIRFNIVPLSQDPYKQWLDRLLFFRNKLSHGEYSIPITQKIIDEMSQIVICSMHEVAVKILDGYRNKSYLNT